MVHKFEAIRKNSCLRDNVFVFIDEAYRSVAKDLGAYLMAAVPNATIIGFTGTPIARTAQGEGTFKIFGAEDERGYLDKYSIADSIDDEATIPIKHLPAPSTMTVPAEQLDKEFFELAGSEGVTDIQELNKVLHRAVELRTLLTADDRIIKVGGFVAEHSRNASYCSGRKLLGCREPRGQREVQAGALQASAARMDRGDLLRTRRTGSSAHWWRSYSSLRSATGTFGNCSVSPPRTRRY